VCLQNLLELAAGDANLQEQLPSYLLTYLLAPHRLCRVANGSSPMFTFPRPSPSCPIRYPRIQFASSSRYQEVAAIPILRSHQKLHNNPATSNPIESHPILHAFPFFPLLPFFQGYTPAHFKKLTKLVVSPGHPTQIPYPIPFHSIVPHIRGTQTQISKPANQQTTLFRIIPPRPHFSHTRPPAYPPPHHPPQKR
jgi:hypothetical protein